MNSVSPPSGLRDFLNDDARRRLKLISQISEVYQSFGFYPLETPAFENLDILLGKGGDENEKLIFKVLKRGNKLQEALSSKEENQIAEFGLRFDLTLPLSRVVAHHRGKIQFPWKVFHIGPVWRAERPQKGRFREFLQCDVDIVGAKGMGAEIEVIQAVVKAIHEVGGRGFELRMNDRRLIQAMGQKFGFGEDKIAQFAIALDKKDKMEPDEFLQSLQELLGQELPPDLSTLLEGKLDLETAKQFHPEAADSLKSIFLTLSQLELPLTQIIFDSSLVRGMGYYTGAVFELRHSSAGYSFGGGGRYDRLIGRLSGQEVPACGFSLGFERLVLLLEETEGLQSSHAKVVFVPVFAESLRSDVSIFAQELRKQGIAVNVFPDHSKIKNQFKFASEAGHRWVLILGEEEWISKVFKLKDFQTGKEILLSREQVASKLREVLS